MWPPTMLGVGEVSRDRFDAAEASLACIHEGKWSSAEQSQHERQRQIERERERECVCVCVEVSAQTPCLFLL
jgi:hypothetical protein